VCERERENIIMVSLVVKEMGFGERERERVLWWLRRWVSIKRGELAVSYR
jgi:hypothetical protein